MAKGRERFEKRLREQAKRDKAKAKAERKEERKAADEGPDDEQALLEQYRRLSEAHADGEISDEDFAERKGAIFEQLGIDLD